MTPPRLRIAIAAHRAHEAGGVEKYLSTLVPALVADGQDVACWFETGSAVEHPEVRWSGVTCWTATDRPLDSIRDLQRWRPEVIFVQGIASPELEQALMTIAPSVCFAHSYYGTCISGSKLQRSPHERCCTRRFGSGCLLRYLPAALRWVESSHTDPAVRAAKGPTRSVEQGPSHCGRVSTHGGRVHQARPRGESTCRAAAD